ncbi:hypothetical protein P4E94_13655 [Pontiellaceae bacterium B12219]|nr:hypothetical protein [Pontiellaceae bacterium B12219]
MNLDAAKTCIEAALQKLEIAIGEPVFNEWAIVEKSSLLRQGSGGQAKGWKLAEYGGSRKEAFIAEFSQDMAALKETLDPDNIQLGDFAFSHEGFGSGFDAHMCVGEAKLILFNNTEKNTDQITSNPKWTQAQIHFSNLLEAFIADPLV